MGKRKVPRSTIIRIETERIPDSLYQKLVEESGRRNNINFQSPELPGISLANIVPFSAKNEGGLKEAEKYLLGILRNILRKNPSRIIFQKTRRKTA